MEPVDVSLTAIFRIRIICCDSSEIGTPRENYFKLLELAANMEPDRIALTLEYGFLVSANYLEAATIRLTRTWRKMHKDLDFAETPALLFSVEPMFRNTNKPEVFLGDEPPNNYDALSEMANTYSWMLVDRLMRGRNK